MTDQPRPDHGSRPALQPEAAPANQTIDQSPSSADLDAGLHAAFADSGPPLPAGGSVLKALSADLPNVPRVHLREPEDEHPTPVNKPHSEQMPRPEELPGRYQLVGEIARGGMGAVFKGRDVDLGRDIAVKVMLEGHQGRTELLQRFVEEAQIGGQLQHPGIVPVYELGQAGDQRPYFTMKLVKGRTLAQLLKERAAGRDKGEPLAAARFLTIFAQVCQTLAYAHARGVIHRDLKPANIMVGSFGEVQVMDWGLAKVLPRGGVADEQRPPREPADEVSVIRTVRSAEPPTPVAASLAAGSQTHAGTVLGTPAYMAPEQARGDSDTLDERCDVFGLGALLCEIFTGRPPFWQGSAEDKRQQAAAGDLADAGARLDGCGADAELIALARRCLAAAKADRPRHAGEVAVAVERHQAAVQERLHRAELERAAAQVKAAEEHKRHQVERQKRRATLAAAVAGLLLVIGVAGAALWYQQQAVELTARKKYLEKEVTNALGEAERLHQQLYARLGDPLQAHELLSDLDQWQAQLRAAQASRQQAQLLAATGPELLPAEVAERLHQLEGQLAAAEQDYQLAKELDDVRLKAADPVDGKYDPPQASPKYAAVFRQHGLNLEREDPKVLAAKIRRQPARYVLVATLDHWAVVAPNVVLRERVLAVARQSDRDPWRDQFRQSKVWADSKNLQQLARTVDPAKQSPQTLLALALAIRQSGQGDEAERVFRRALLHYPRDFWLHFWLGHTVKTTAEKAGCFRAALAVRPTSCVAHNNLGVALDDQKDLEGAVEHYTKALQLDRNYVNAHNNLGLALRDKGDLAGAIQECRRAIKLDPKNVAAYTNLGNALRDQKNLKGAIAEYRRAMELDSKYARAHNGLGIALFLQKDLKSAIVAYRRAIDLDPKLVQAHNNLGNALHEQQDPNGAIAAYRHAIALDPKFAGAHYNLGKALRDQNDLAGAIQAYHRAIELEPKFAEAHCNLGTALATKGDLAGAIQEYRRAIQLDPKLAPVHYGLGEALRIKGDLAGAIQECRRAIELEPNDANAHYNLGIALAAKRDQAGTIQECRRAIKLDPKLDKAYVALGLGLLAQGEFAEAQQAVRQGLSLLPQGHPLRGQFQRSLQLCQKALQVEQRVNALIQGQAQPTGPAEQLELAQFCQQVKHFPAAARLYSAVLTAKPDLAENLNKGYRYNAACAGARAAAGQGKDADQLTAADKAKLRRQALDWLRADLKQLTRIVTAYRPGGTTGDQKPASPPEQLTGPTQPPGPIDLMRVCDQLRHWQTDPDLASLRHQKELAKLPPDEQKDWQKLWAEVSQLDQQARRWFTEQRVEGSLTDEQKQQNHDLKLQAGKLYVFDLQSATFAPLLRLDETGGKIVGRNNGQRSGTMRYTQLLFTPKQDGSHRLVVASFLNLGRGAYVLRIAEFAEPTEPAHQKKDAPGK